MFKEEVYEFVKEKNRHIIIGFGSYGEVKLAKRGDSNDYVAIKMVIDVSFRFTARMHSTRSLCINSSIIRGLSNLLTIITIQIKIQHTWF
jgi:hypothetical protein